VRGDCVAKASAVTSFKLANQSAANPTRIGKRMRELRVRAGLTQGAVGRLLGHVGHGRVCRIENGRHCPSLPFIAAYCTAIGVALQDVFVET
jgi:DNA-binding XRE family transcriptional regulator